MDFNTPNASPAKSATHSDTLTICSPTPSPIRKLEAFLMEEPTTPPSCITPAMPRAPKRRNQLGYTQRHLIPRRLFVNNTDDNHSNSNGFTTPENQRIVSIQPKAPNRRRARREDRDFAPEFSRVLIFKDDRDDLYNQLTEFEQQRLALIQNLNAKIQQIDQGNTVTRHKLREYLTYNVEAINSMKQLTVKLAEFKFTADSLTNDEQAEVNTYHQNLLIKFHSTLRVMNELYRDYNKLARDYDSWLQQLVVIYEIRDLAAVFVEVRSDIMAALNELNTDGNREEWLSQLTDQDLLFILNEGVTFAEELNPQTCRSQIKSHFLDLYNQSMQSTQQEVSVGVH